MLVNLMPPVDVEPIPKVRLREAEIVTAPVPTVGTFVVHPRYKQWLARCAIDSAEAALNLPGEIVSGHPDRHVMQVAVKSGTSVRTLFLKREHAVGWRVRFRNWQEGFGWVSRSEREAKILQQLEERGLPGPHGVAYGEDARGRAFLLVDELVGHRELREVAGDSNYSASERRTIALKLGEYLADLHAAGFRTPDLAAKHVFVRTGSFSATLLDWLSSGPLSPGETIPRLEALAHLNASLAEGLAAPRERLRLLHAYFRRMKQSSPDSVPKFGPFVRTIQTLTLSLRNRSSIREQCLPNARSAEQRLVWLSDEQVCAIPEIAKSWPKPELCEPFYVGERELLADGERLSIRLADGRPATLARFRTFDPLGRCLAFVRGKSWRSPAAKLARLLFQLQKAGANVPQLYAFGQRLQSSSQADSFLAYGLAAGSTTLDSWLCRKGKLHERRQLLKEFGAALRLVHDAGCLLGGSPESFRITVFDSRARLKVDPTFDGKPVRNMNENTRVQNITLLLRALTQKLSRVDALRVLRGYEPAKECPLRNRFSSILQQVSVTR